MPPRRARFDLRLRALGIACAAMLAMAPAAEAAEAFADGMRLHLEKRYGDSRPVFEALARGGDARAQFMMGTIYEQGLGVPKDLAAAAEWYRRAAEGGNASAQYNLGIFYQFGKGVPKNSAEAARLLRLAAERGHGRAQNNLSTFYFTGVGVARDPVEAWKWLTLSAEDLEGSGRQIALDNRAVIERAMTPEQIAEAQRRTAEWRRAHAR